MSNEKYNAFMLHTDSEGIVVDSDFEEVVELSTYLDYQTQIEAMMLVRNMLELNDVITIEGSADTTFILSINGIRSLELVRSMDND